MSAAWWCEGRKYARAMMRGRAEIEIIDRGRARPDTSTSEIRDMCECIDHHVVEALVSMAL